MKNIGEQPHHVVNVALNSSFSAHQNTPVLCGTKEKNFKRANKKLNINKFVPFVYGSCKLVSVHARTLTRVSDVYHPASLDLGIMQVLYLIV